MNQEPINNKIVYWKFTKFIITNELVKSALSRTIKNKKFLLLAFALQLRHRPPTTTLRTIMSSTTSSSRETKYKLPDYSELTLQELLTACQQRRLGNVGHKHELIRRLVNDTYSTRSGIRLARRFWRRRRRFGRPIGMVHINSMSPRWNICERG